MMRMRMGLLLLLILQLVAAVGALVAKQVWTIFPQNNWKTKNEEDKETSDDEGDPIAVDIHCLSNKLKLAINKWIKEGMSG